MSRSIGRAVPALLAAAGLLATAFAGEAWAPSTVEEKNGYSIGYQVGGDFRRQGLQLDPQLLVAGVMDALSGSESRMSPAEIRRALIDIQQQVDLLERQARQLLLQRNMEEAIAFLAENGRRADVRTLPSGLQYRVLEEGTGGSPQPAGTVTLHYRGTRIDGSEFESSRRIEPATYRFDQVLPGWREALPLMKEGARWELFVPPELAYGAKGHGRIEPNTAVIFEIELISVGAPE